MNIGRAFIVERGRKGEGLHKFLTKVNQDLPQGRERLARVLRDIRNVSDDDPMELAQGRERERKNTQTLGDRKLEVTDQHAMDWTSKKMKKGKVLIL